MGEDPPPPNYEDELKGGKKLVNIEEIKNVKILKENKN